ncbi:protein kinase domain-containing protein [Aeromicrobium terrae]|uniref:non-specific serine/threonine protein kinase n=1 Tax=Aeromicrobium terrae TaxID=2498846 RepID=A0A5C8NN34_9ACTN|nr:protein kinase [Aeromicrobium terrae]TXL63234.1 PASTA domain-containing protein [Aeromicrobium terrae]
MPHATRTMLERYQLDEVIGSGGMGEVWRAHDAVLERDVAVKVLKRDAVDDAAALERLRIEARLAGSLQHPNVVGVLDYGEEESSEGGTAVLPCLVMPLIDGCTLSDRLRDSGPMSPAETMRMVSEVADGLSAAHLAGIVHRDLKPGNIMQDASGRSMILDFGIARSSDASPLTSTGTIVGTTDFISPEQASGRTATAASDLYSLGVVAYCCLTGKAPFHRTAAVAIALAHVNEPPPPLPENVPAGVRALIMRMLAKDPEDRPADAAEVRDAARALADALVDDPTAGSLAPPTAAIPLPVDPPTLTDTPLPGEKRRLRRNPLLLLIALVVATLVALGIVALANNGGTEVPDVVGEEVAVAKAHLEDAGFKVETASRDVAGHKRGEVVEQDPGADESVDKGSTVELVVASGFVKIPDLKGMSQADAVKALDKLGLEARISTRIAPQDAGKVLDVAPDDRARIGDTVDLVVATAPFGAPKPKKGDKPKKEKGAKKPKAGPEPTSEPVNPSPSPTPTDDGTGG